MEALSSLDKCLALGELGRSLHSSSPGRNGPLSMAIFGQFSVTIFQPTSTKGQLVQHEHSCGSPFGRLVSVLKTVTRSMCITLPKPTVQITCCGRAHAADIDH